MQQTWLRCIRCFLVGARAEGHFRGKTGVDRRLAGSNQILYFLLLDESDQESRLSASAKERVGLGVKLLALLSPSQFNR